MKSIFLLFSILLSSLTAALAQDRDATFQQRIKDLHIKTRAEYFVDLASPDKDPEGKLSHLEEYERDGKLTANTWYNYDGSMKRKQIFTYNDRGEKIEEQWYSSSDTLNTYRFTFDYNEKGQMIHARHYIGQDKILFIYTQDFDAQGNVKTKYQFRNDSTLFIRTVYEREENRIYIKEYNKRGGIRRHYIDRYTAEGDLASTEQYDHLDQLVLKEYYTYLYDDKNLMTEVKAYDEYKKLISILRIVYDYY